MDKSVMDGVLYREYDLGNIFIDALYNQLELDESLSRFLEDEYQINDSTEIGVLGMYLGKTYQEDYKRVYEGLVEFGKNSMEIGHKVICLPMNKLVLFFLYPIQQKRPYSYYQFMVQNELSLFAPECSIFVGEHCIGMKNMPKILEKITGNLDWNLVLGARVLINEDKLKNLNIKLLKYPTEYDGEVEMILLRKNRQGFEGLFEGLKEYCRTEIHSPESIKSVCMRYALVIAHVARMNGYEHGEIEVQKLIKNIVNAVYWTEIQDEIYEYAIDMLAIDKEDKDHSLLVVQARKMMQEYYGTGITLEEIASKLYVSEEYLSKVFKKETGMTFTETIRGYRMKKIKLLLTTSQLKIDQIAKLSGYSDGKYMSRVFKEEMGMNPNEYRKTRCD